MLMITPRSLIRESGAAYQRHIGVGSCGKNGISGPWADSVERHRTRSRISLRSAKAVRYPGLAMRRTGGRSISYPTLVKAI